MEIVLTCSELSKYTGHNKYDAKNIVIDKLLKRCGIQDCYIPKSNIEQSLVELDPKELLQLKNELKLPVSTSVLDIEKIVKQKIMSSSYNPNISESQSKDLIDMHVKNNPIMKKISHSIKQDLQMRRGNIKENKNLDKIQSKQNIAITKRNSCMYTKPLYSCEDYTILLRGKIDGQTDDTIIESKNRTNRLFYELRPYERVQLESYMFLTGMKKAILTEHYNKTENCIEYTHNKDFWDDCVEKTISFIDTYIKPHITQK